MPRKDSLTVSAAYPFAKATYISLPVLNPTMPTPIEFPGKKNPSGSHTRIPRGYRRAPWSFRWVKTQQQQLKKIRRGERMESGWWPRCRRNGKLVNGDEVNARFSVEIPSKTRANNVRKKIRM
jgi:hypothetical protein